MLNWNHPNIPIFEAATEMASPRPETFGAGLMKTFKVHGVQRSGFGISGLRPLMIRLWLLWFLCGPGGLELPKPAGG